MTCTLTGELLNSSISGFNMRNFLMITGSGRRDTNGARSESSLTCSTRWFRICERQMERNEWGIRAISCSHMRNLLASSSLPGRWIQVSCCRFHPTETRKRAACWLPCHVSQHSGELFGSFLEPIAHTLHPLLKKNIFLNSYNST